MEVIMSKNAVETLIERVGESTKIALALINDPDPFLRDKGAFVKDSPSQIIPFASEFGKYATKIEHPLLDIYTSKLEQSYFGKRLNMDFNKQLDSFSLEDEVAVPDYSIRLENCFSSWWFRESPKRRHTLGYYLVDEEENVMETDEKKYNWPVLDSAKPEEIEQAIEEFELPDDIFVRAGYPKEVSRVERLYETKLEHPFPLVVINLDQSDSYIEEN